MNLAAAVDVVGPPCPRCGFRGCYEGLDGTLYCQEPGCAHAARLRAWDAAAESARKAELELAATKEKAREAAFEEYEERLRRSRR